MIVLSPVLASGSISPRFAFNRVAARVKDELFNTKLDWVLKTDNEIVYNRKFSCSKEKINRIIRGGVNLEVYYGSSLFEIGRSF